VVYLANDRCIHLRILHGALTCCAGHMASGPGYVFVRYFATGETGRLRAADAAPFRAGLAAGRHAAKVSRSAHAAFARALDEAAAYLQVCCPDATPGPAPAPDHRTQSCM